MTNVLPHTTNLDVSSNEYSLAYTVQRIIDRLFENDLALEKLYESVFSRTMIYEYDVGLEYKYNDVVWFLHKNKTAKIADLYVLRCDKSTMPANSLSDFPTKTFQAIGWKDLNPDVDIFTQYGLDKKIGTFFNKMFKQHTDDVVNHKYGKISYDKTSRNHLDNKVARRDVSNLNPYRENVFFPNESICLTRNMNSPIVNGNCRWYDNGILEYDIVFRLGYVGYQLVDEEYNISADIISCNSIDFRTDNTMSKYFLDTDDRSIFYQLSSKYEAEVGGTVQKNTNDYVNVYSATIDFAEAAGGLVGKTLYEFDNTDYMIFGSDQLMQKRCPFDDSINPSSNSMVFCAKHKDRFTAMLIVYPSQKNMSKTGFNAMNTGILANSFHCHVIGKGKVRS